MKVKIEKIEKGNNCNTCLLSSDLYNDLKIYKRKSYKIHLGQLVESSIIEIWEDRSTSIAISEDIYNKLLLYDDLTLNIWIRGEDIYLGPVLGMFIKSGDFKRMEKYRVSIDVIEHIKKAGSYKNYLSYCFSKDNINWEDKKIKGYVFLKKLNSWQKKWLPMPDVIYDRALYSNVNKPFYEDDIRKRFRKNTNIKFINSYHNLDKWLVYKCLYKCSEVKDYIPSTIAYKKFEDIIYMINKHDFIFFKPCLSKDSNELLSIEKCKKSYRIYLYKGKFKMRFLNDIEKFKVIIENYVKENRSQRGLNFILQQGIKGIKYKDNDMKLRILIAKNQFGNWRGINFYGLCENGDINNYEKVYKALKIALFPKDASWKVFKTLENIESISCKIGEAMDKKFSNLGEMEIDIIIDKMGKIWFLGLDTEPNKYETLKSYNEKKIQIQALSVFDYADYLTRDIKFK